MDDVFLAPCKPDTLLLDQKWMTLGDELTALPDVTSAGDAVRAIGRRMQRADL